MKIYNSLWGKCIYVCEHMDISQLEDCFKNITVLYIKAYFQYTWVTDILAYFTILSKYTYQFDSIFK